MLSTEIGDIHIMNYLKEIDQEKKNSLLKGITQSNTFVPIVPAVAATVLSGSIVPFFAFYASARIGGQSSLFSIKVLQRFRHSRLLQQIEQIIGGKPYHSVKRSNLALLPPPPKKQFEAPQDENNIIQKGVHGMIEYTLKGIDLIVYHQNSFYWLGLSFWLAMMFVFIDALTPLDQNFEARMKKTDLRQMLNVFKKANKQ